MPSPSEASASPRMPILETLQALANQPDAAFYAPGHKRGQGIYQPLANFLGNSVFRADLPELPQLDNLFAPEGVIEEAQALAAETFGASKTWFLVNGSTCGIIAAILATCGAGDKIILPRNSHQSAIAGLILSGAIPVFIYPEYDPKRDLTYSVTPEAVEAALKQHPDAKAVMVVYPTYEGVCGDLAAIAQVTHQFNIPLLVDEAHGAHFAFHPHLPPTALAVGADLTVQSTHKVLGAMTQASMLHIQGNRVDPQRITKALSLMQSTSPSYLLLASLDAARQQMALQGRELIGQTLELAKLARRKIAQIPGLSMLKPPIVPASHFYALDPTRLTVNVAGLGFSGFEADDFLQQQGVTAELPTLQHLTFIISIGNTATDIDKLVQAFTTLGIGAVRHGELNAKPKTYQNMSFLLSSFVLGSLSPRQAFFAPSHPQPLEATVGCISAEIVCPYPPGIPVLMPGEAIAPEAITYLQQVIALGGTITGCSDPRLQTLVVIG